MNMNKNWATILFYNFKPDLNRKECFKETNSVFCDKSYSLAIVKLWYNEFQLGRLSSNDIFKLLGEKHSCRKIF